MFVKRCALPTAPTSCTAAPFSAAARQTVSRKTKRSDGFIWGPSSDWTKMGVGIALVEFAQGNRRLDKDLADARLHGNPAETSHQARSEADPDTLAAAGHQAAADVDVGTVRSLESGNGREPDARRGSDRGAPARRSSRRAGKDRDRPEGQQ